MDAATDSKIEIGCTMKCTDEHWQSIFKPKETVETKEESEDGR